MSQQPIKWNASHCCFAAEAGKRSGSAAVGQRVTFYSLDAAQTAADPLSYISESLICQPPPANKVCLQSINLQVCLEGAHNPHKLSFHLTKWGKVTKILTHSRSVQHSHMSCGYFFVCLFLKTCNLLNYVFFSSRWPQTKVWSRTVASGVRVQHFVCPSSTLTTCSWLQYGIDVVFDASHVTQWL